MHQIVFFQKWDSPGPLVASRGLLLREGKKPWSEVKEMGKKEMTEGREVRERAFGPHFADASAVCVTSSALYLVTHLSVFYHYRPRLSSPHLHVYVSYIHVIVNK